MLFFVYAKIQKALVATKKPDKSGFINLLKLYFFIEVVDVAFKLLICIE